MRPTAVLIGFTSTNRVRCVPRNPQQLASLWLCSGQPRDLIVRNSEHADSAQPQNGSFDTRPLICAALSWVWSGDKTIQIVAELRSQNEVVVGTTIYQRSLTHQIAYISRIGFRSIALAGLQALIKPSLVPGPHTQLQASGNVTNESEYLEFWTANQITG